MKYYYLEYNSNIDGIIDAFILKREFDTPIEKKWKEKAEELAYEKYLNLYHEEPKELNIDCYVMSISDIDYEYSLGEIEKLDYL